MFSEKLILVFVFIAISLVQRYTFSLALKLGGYISYKNIDSIKANPIKPINIILACGTGYFLFNLDVMFLIVAISIYAIVIGMDLYEIKGLNNGL